MHDIKSWKHYDFYTIFFAISQFLSSRKCHNRDFPTLFMIVLRPLFCVHLHSSRVRRKVWNKVHDSRFLSKIFFANSRKKCIGIIDTFFEGTTRFPPKRVLCLCRIADRDSEIDLPTTHDLYRYGGMGDFLGHSDELSD